MARELASRKRAPYRLAALSPLRSYLLVAFAVLASVWSAPDAMAVTLKPGDIVYADAGGCCGPRTIFHIDGSTLARSVITTNGYLAYPVDVEVVPTSTGHEIFVGDLAAFESGAVIRVDPATGGQSVVSFGSPFVNPSGIHVKSAGKILVGDPLATVTPSFGALFEVDAVTGDKVTVCAGGFFAATDSSRNFGMETQIALEPGGTILMTSAPYFFGSRANPDAKILRCNPVTHEVTALVSGGGNVLLGAPAGVTVSSAGDVFVTDPHGAVVGAGLMKIHPVNGAQTIICPNAPGGSSGQASKITLDLDGNLVYVVNFPDNSNGIVRLNPLTCSYAVLGQGPNNPGGFYSPAGLRVVRSTAANQLDVAVRVVRIEPEPRVAVAANVRLLLTYDNTGNIATSVTTRASLVPAGQTNALLTYELDSEISLMPGEHRPEVQYYFGIPADVAAGDYLIVVDLVPNGADNNPDDNRAIKNLTVVAPLLDSEQVVVGTALRGEVLKTPGTDAYRLFAATQFSRVTTENEMKFRWLQPCEGVFTFTDDPSIETCVDHYPVDPDQSLTAVHAKQDLTALQTFVTETSTCCGVMRSCGTTVFRCGFAHFIAKV